MRAPYRVLYSEPFGFARDARGQARHAHRVGLGRDRYRSLLRVARRISPDVCAWTHPGGRRRVARYDRRHLRPDCFRAVDVQEDRAVQSGASRIALIKFKPDSGFGQRRASPFELVLLRGVWNANLR